MYRCAECNKVSRPRDPLNKIVTKTRPAKYFDRATGKIVGQGNEIVEEKGLCLLCYNDRRVEQLDEALLMERV
jgi:hypothetical protein